MPPSADAARLAGRLKQRALEIGFDRAGIARLEPTPESEAFRGWIEQGRHGAMGYLERRLEERVDPRKAMDGARSALVVGLVYDQPPSPPRQGDRMDLEKAPSTLGQEDRLNLDQATSPLRQGDCLEYPLQAAEGGAQRAAGEQSSSGRAAAQQPTARIARYAGGDDYHDVLLEGLRRIGEELAPLAGRPVRWRAYVDTGPVLERVLAAYAGLGWIGKNTCLIDRELGSYLFLGVLLLDLELPPDAREPDHCGSCRACLDACPTGAFPAPYALDATRCLSYTTIELRGPIAEPLREPQGDWVFGCDVCQEVCPWNTRARRPVPADRGGMRARLAPRPEWSEPALARLLGLDEPAWRTAARGTALRRAKHRGLLRNALVAAGNAGDPLLAPQLERHARGADPLLAEHARWALDKLGR